MQVDEEAMEQSTCKWKEAMYSMWNNLHARMRNNEEAMYSMQNNLHASG